MASRVKTASCQSKRRRTGRQWETEISIRAVLAVRVRPPHIWGNHWAFPHIFGSLSSYMTLQLLHSEFPYIWGKFYFLFYQCILTTLFHGPELWMLTGGELKLDGKQGGSSQAGRQVAACRQQHNSRPQHLVFLWGLTGGTVADKAKRWAFLSAVLLERIGKGRLCHICYLTTWKP